MEDLLKNAGLSRADSAKAIKAIKSGRVNMGEIAAKLGQSKIPTITDPRERLQAILKQKRGERGTKESKDQAYEKMQEQVALDKAAREKAAEEKTAKLAAAKRNRVKKMKELQTKYGTITDEVYQEAMNNISNISNGKNPEEVNRWKNIVELYARQNKFAEKVDFADLDDI